MRRLGLCVAIFVAACEGRCGSGSDTRRQAESGTAGCQTANCAAQQARDLYEALRRDHEAARVALPPLWEALDSHQCARVDPLLRALLAPALDDAHARQRAELVNACRTVCPPPTVPAAAAAATDSISLERGACYGTCPVYGVKLWGDGRVRYEGKSHVARTGVIEERIPVAAAGDAFALLDSFNFAAMPEEFEVAATDLPTAEIVLSRGGVTKHVRASGPCFGTRAIKRGFCFLTFRLDRLTGADSWAARPSKARSP